MLESLPYLRRVWANSGLTALMPARRRRSEKWPVRQSPGGPFVFIHINKTGGTSIGRALDLPLKQHLTVQEVVAKIGPAAWARAFTFTIVRNPWDKVVSHYKYRVQTNQTGLGTESVPFSRWVAATYGPEKDPRYYDDPRMFQPQSDWLRGPEGEIHLDVIGRFEDLPDAFRRITERLNIPAELPHLNATPPADYRAFYDDASPQVVADWFAEDIARFGYRFDPSAV